MVARGDCRQALQLQRIHIDSPPRRRVFVLRQHLTPLREKALQAHAVIALHQQLRTLTPGQPHHGCGHGVVYRYPTLTETSRDVRRLRQPGERRFQLDGLGAQQRLMAIRWEARTFALRQQCLGKTRVIEDTDSRFQRFVQTRPQ